MLRTKRSRSGSLGFFGSMRICVQKMALIISTTDSDPPGCPLPALAVILMISRRTSVQKFFSSAVFMFR